jgi:hypothetical protein
MTKQEWFDKLCAAKARNGYTPEEIAAYRAELEERYATATDADFAGRS